MSSSFVLLVVADDLRREATTRIEMFASATRRKDNRLGLDRNAIFGLLLPLVLLIFRDEGTAAEPVASDRHGLGHPHNTRNKEQKHTSRLHN